ncbi:MAG: hypothetical protein AAGF12_08930 [Myxococcota bacterium]
MNVSVNTRSARPLTIVPLALVCLAGCGDIGRSDTPPVSFAGESPRSDLDWSYRGARPEVLSADELEADLHGPPLVAPDRALARVHVEAWGRTRAAAFGHVRELFQELQREVQREDSCRLDALNFEPPVRRGEDRWDASSVLRLDIDLSGAEDVSARQARIEGCMGVFPTLDADDYRVIVGAPLITIDHPDAHRTALLERELARLREASALAAPSYVPEEIRCASEGRVRIVRRSLHGVALAVDLNCRRVANPREAAAEVPTQEVVESTAAL